MKRQMGEIELIELVKSGYHAIGFKNKGSFVLEMIDKIVSNCTGSLPEKLFWIKSNLKDYPKCKQCNDSLSSKNFKNSTLGYRDYCSRSCSSKGNQIQFEKTSLLNYGVTHPSKSQIIKDKRSQTNLKLYGDTNPIRWSSEKFKSKILQKYGTKYTLNKDSLLRSDIVKLGLKNKRLNYLRKSEHFIIEAEKRGLVLLNKLNDDYIGQDTKLKWKCNKCEYVSQRVLTSPKCEKCDPNSKPQFKVLEFLREVLDDKDIINNDRLIINPKEIDIYLPNHKIGIEINGLYWHSSQYLTSDYHLSKQKLCLSKGVRLIHLWDHEINDRFDIIKSMVLSLIGKTPNKINGRDCYVREIDSKESNRFLDKNHLQGAAVSSIQLGLFFENTLVSIVTLSKPRFNKHYQWELVRCCSLINTNVRGGISKLMNYFHKKFKGSILTYADKRYSMGNLYEKIGFSYIRTTNPGYFYFNQNGQILSRYKCQKHKLEKLFKSKVDKSLTEQEIMNQYRFYQVHDCGQLVYHLKISE